MNKLVSNRVLLYGSVAAFLYFSSLIVLSVVDLKVTMVGVFAELLTIPFILLLVFISISSFVKLRKKNFDLRTATFITFLLSILTIALLLLATLLKW